MYPVQCADVIRVFFQLLQLGLYKHHTANTGSDLFSCTSFTAPAQITVSILHLFVNKVMVFDKKQNGGHYSKPFFADGFCSEI